MQFLEIVDSIPASIIINGYVFGNPIEKFRIQHLGSFLRISEPLIPLILFTKIANNLIFR